jgi:hypothetical protein
VVCPDCMQPHRQKSESLSCMTELDIPLFCVFLSTFLDKFRSHIPLTYLPKCGGTT